MIAELAEGVCSGNTRSLARAISTIENRRPGYRELVRRLHRNAADSVVVGITGSPGAGKSTLVDQLIGSYRAAEKTVGVVGIDPASPFSGGAILGDRIRLQSSLGDPGVFVRSMSTRGALGGLTPAIHDVITAYEAFGMDLILIETVGAGQNEIDIVRTADSVVVVLQPGSGDDVQMLKAGILEIADILVVNKADMPATDRTVSQLQEMLHLAADTSGEEDRWDPPIVETIATKGDGISDLVSALERHIGHLHTTQTYDERRQRRFAAAITDVLRYDLEARVEAHLERTAGIEHHARRVARRETDPYTIVEELLAATERVEDLAHEQ